MDAELLEQARAVDPAVLGQRIRQARLARQLTQTAVAGSEMSTAYVSRIEAGQRRPDPELIAVIADRVGVDVGSLVTGTSRDVAAEQRLALDWAELSLRTGDAATALAKVDEVLAQDPATDLRRAALSTKAGALESSGRLDDAIIMLEDVVADAPRDVAWLTTVTSLSRAYRVSGDLARAIEVGEQASTELATLGLDAGDESAKLSMTLAAAYFERGDTGHAARLCRRAIQSAEEHASPQARVAVYWNASIIESRRGRAASAVALASKALTILEQGDDHLQLSRLRTQLGIMQLRAESTDLTGALANLRTAESDMRVSHVSVSELTANRVAQARAMVRLGELDAAEALLGEVLTVEHSSPLVAADAQVLLGQAAAVKGDDATARAMYQRAVLTLSAVGADRSAAQLWFELGTLLEHAGDSAGAVDAFRRAGASTGLTAINVAIGAGVREASLVSDEA